MRISDCRAIAIGAVCAVTVVGCEGAAPGPGESAADRTDGIVKGATYTTFDATRGGCLDSPNGINCNHYAASTTST